jgi:hypothetical protein
MTSKPNAGGKEGKGEDLLRNAFGKTLRRWRTLKGNPNQTELSRRAGLPAYVVGNIERCQRPINLEEVVKICHGLEMDHQQFLDEVNLMLQTEAQPIAESLRVGEGKEGLKERPTEEEELRKAVDLVLAKLKEVFLSRALAANRSVAQAGAEPRRRSGRKRSKPTR